jgi:hypothetical protein
MIARVRDLLVIANLVGLLVVSVLAIWHLSIVVSREQDGPCTRAVTGYLELFEQTTEKHNVLMVACLKAQIYRGGAQ